jgi:hypothetical protein
MRRKTSHSMAFLFFGVAFLLSCKEEKETPPVAVNPVNRQLVILNEGNFRSANASVSLYDVEANQVENDIYSRSNQGVPLGDVAQSMQVINGEGFVVVNNSNKIELVDPVNFRSLGSMKGFNSPRYILSLNANKAYVTDLYEHSVSIIDPQARTITGSIPLNGNSEKMAFYKNQALICSPSQNQLIVVDALADTILHRLPTPRRPIGVVVDQMDQVWVHCTGGYSGEPGAENPALVKFDPKDWSEVLRWTYPDLNKSITHMEYNSSAELLYFLMSDLYAFHIADTVQPQQPLISAGSKNFYGLGLDPKSGELYLSDAIDYQQAGVIYRYRPSGELITTFKAGLIPSFFYFLN